MRNLPIISAVFIVLCLASGLATAHTMDMEDSSHVMVTDTPSVNVSADIKGTTLNSLTEESHAVHSGGNPAHTDDDLCKIFVIVLGVCKDGAFLESAEVHYGHPPNAGYQNGNFRVILRAHNGTALMSYNIWDPRIQLEPYGFRNELKRHEDLEDPSIEAGMEGEDIDLPLFIPYHKDIHTVELVDINNGSRLVSVNLSPAVDAFRSKFPHDPDMLSLQRSQKSPPALPGGVSEIILPAGIGIAVILIGLLIFLIRRR